MSASDDTHLFHTRLLSHLKRQCVGRHGNVTTFLTTPTFESSTGEEDKVENTDFGAVMYIAAVLVFYSLGIVVMIVKYLKTEQKELEEEMALESFFKGIPSKKMEHNRDAVNRVAIRAFHTLTSGAKRQDQLLMTAQQNIPTTPDGDCGGVPTMQEPKPASSPVSDDSDSSRSDPCPQVLQREPSKYLPRVSLNFRYNRSNDSCKMYDNTRVKTELAHSHCSLPSGQRSPSDASAPLHENRRARVCSHDTRESSDCSDNSLPRDTSCHDVSNDPIAHKRHVDPSRNISQKNSVSFVDEISTRGKPPCRRKPRNKPSTSYSSLARPAPKSAIKRHSSMKDDDLDHLKTPSRAQSCEAPQPDRTLSVGNGAVSPAVSQRPSFTAVLLDTVIDNQGLVQKTVTQIVPETAPPSKGLLVSDV